MATLRSQTVTGMIWSLLQNIGARGGSFIVTIILARLLTPEMFGLVGMLTIFIELSGALVVAGFNEALIQKKNADELDFSSVFWINLVISILLYAVLFFSAPLIADFYHQPQLVLLTRGLSVVFVVNAFSYVQETRIRKNMDFKTLTVIHVPSVIISGMISVGLAFAGFGVWSIVAMEVVSRLAFTIQIWFYSKWRPSFVFESDRVKKLFSFGSKLMLSAVLHSVFQNIYLVVIGRFFPLSSVGFYQNANKLVNSPSSVMSLALSNVAFPAFSTIQDDNERLKRGYKKIVKQVLFWLCPIFLISGVLARPLFQFVLGNQWLPAVPYFQILCITGIFYPLSSYNLSIVNVKGRSDIFLKLEIVKKVITAIGIILAIPFGIWALVGFQAINAVFSYLINGHFSGKFIGYPIKEQLVDIFPIVLLSFIVCIPVYLIQLAFPGLPGIIELILGYGIGGGAYLIISWWNKLSPYIDFMEIIKTRKKNPSF